MTCRALLCQLTALLCTAAAGYAENWGQWRGPSFNGSSPETGLPAKWTAEEAKWKTPLPGPSGATPVVWGDSVFVSTPDENQNLLLLCLDRATGKERWRKTVVEGGNVKHGRGNAASPSPVTDGKAVYMLFSSGALVAYDFAGQELWRRELAQDYGKFALMWVYGSSPLLFQGKLYVQVLQRTPVPADYPGFTAADTGDRESFLLALDAATGKTLWRHVRVSPEARVESNESYATPVPHVGADGKAQILIVGGNCLTGHDPETGEELWRGYGLNRKNGEFMRVVPSPVSAEGLAIACGPKGEQMLAFRTDLRGDISEKGVAWVFDEKRTPDVCTPALADGHLFVLDGDHHVLTCMDPKTGSHLWQGTISDRNVIRSSPTVADGKLYTLDEKGTVGVYGAGDHFEELAQIPMGGEIGAYATVVVAAGDLFIRTTDALYCVGK